MRSSPHFVKQEFRSILRFRKKGDKQVFELRFDEAPDAHKCLIDNGIQVLAVPTGKDRHGRPVLTHEDFVAAAKTCAFDWHEFSFIPMSPRWGY
jgi:hypothetical protein